MKGYIKDEDGYFDYYYKGEVEKGASLYYHEAGSWISPLHKKVAAKVLEDGDGFDVIFFDHQRGAKRKVRLNYTEAHELRILLQLLHKESSFYFGKSTRVERTEKEEEI